MRLVPRRKVVTYGQVAALIGLPRHARQVGYALAALPEQHDVPWHRVINARGEVSQRASVDYAHYQQVLLEEEGVVFNAQGRINLTEYQWDPDAAV